MVAKSAGQSTARQVAAGQSGPHRLKLHWQAQPPLTACVAAEHEEQHSIQPPPPSPPHVRCGTPQPGRRRPGRVRHNRRLISCHIGLHADLDEIAWGSSRRAYSARRSARCNLLPKRHGCCCCGSLLATAAAAAAAAAAGDFWLHQKRLDGFIGTVAYRAAAGEET